MHPLPRLTFSLLLLAAAEAGAQNHVTYYGGPVISNPGVVVVAWGPNVDPYLSNSMPSFYTSILQSPYLDWLSEYSTVGLSGVLNPDAGTNQRIGRGIFVDSVTINPANTGTFLSNTDVLTELQSQIANGNLPQPQLDAQGHANTVYMVNFPPGISITAPAGESCIFPGGFCGTSDTLSVGSQTAGVGLIPDQSDAGSCFGQCGVDPDYFNDATEVHSHVLLNLVTNVDEGLWKQSSSALVGPPLAWYSAGGAENQIADFCNLQPAVVGGFTVEEGWSNLQGACVSGPATDLAVCTAGVSYCRQCSTTDVGQDGGCTGATSYCETNSSNASFGQCVGCTLSQGCSGTAPICTQGGTGNDTCRGCTGDAECTTNTAGPYCQTSGACGPQPASGAAKSGGCSTTGAPVALLALLAVWWPLVRRRAPASARRALASAAGFSPCPGGLGRPGNERDV